MLTKLYRQPYNCIRPHSSLGYRSPLPETVLPAGYYLVVAGLS